MELPMRWTLFLRRVGTATLTLAAFSGAVMALPLAADAQVAGGSMAGGGAPPVNNELLDSPTGPIDLPRCIHSVTDDSQSTDPDDKRLAVWLSVRQRAIVKVTVNGFASGAGTLKITLMSDGIPVAYSEEVQGSGIVSAHTGADMTLVPGRQYKISIKPTGTNMSFGRFVMDVGIGRTCP